MDDCRALAEAFPRLGISSTSCCTSIITGSVDITAVADNSIICRGGRIVALSLWGNNLNGIVPAELSRLRNLRRLIIYLNKLFGPIPSGLMNLSNLEYLGLNDNLLTGTLPPGLIDIPSMVFFEVENNFLIGGVPEALSRKAFQEKKIYGNCFSDVPNPAAYVKSSSSTATSTLSTSSTFVSTITSSSALSTSTSSTSTSAPDASSLTPTDVPSQSFSTTTAITPTAPPSLLTNPTAPSTTGTLDAAGTSSSAPPVAAIAGGTAGFLVLAAVAAIAAFLVHRRRRSERDIIKAALAPDLAPMPPPAAPDPAAPEPAAADKRLPPLPQVLVIPGSVAKPTSPQQPEKSGYGLEMFQHVQRSPGGPQREPRPPSAEEVKAMVVVSEKKADFQAMVVLPDKPVDVKPMVILPMAPPRTNSLYNAVKAKAVSASNARRVSALSASDVSERLLTMGVGAALVAALEDNHVNGARLLSLHDGDLVAIGIKESTSRDLVLRAVGHVIADSEQRHVDPAGSRRTEPEALPEYS
ncbi:hypothetical protein HDU96_007265 [Phlyctochytrium bullatum]|nr:hypothetical protein HDU96_007265 [Phlyctochytrium bullatum]